jgi:hypothetical protein
MGIKEKIMGIVDRNPKVRPYGSFGYQPVASFIEVEPSAPYTELGRSLLGGHICPQYLYGSFRSHDGKRYHAALRGWQHDYATHLLAYPSDVGKDFEPPKFGYRGYITNGEKDGKWGYWQDVPNPRASFLADKEEGHWFEKDLIDVTGKSFGNAWQVAFPDREDPFVYTSRGYKVEDGVVMGDRVAGYFFSDTMHLGLGKGWMTSPYYEKIDQGWVVFVTEFEDGTIHSGNIMWGAENWRCAIIDRSDGDKMIVTNFEVEARFDEHNFCEHFAADLGDGEIWEWHAVEGARLPLKQVESFPGPFYREGVVLRKGETRKWVHSDAWVETFLVKD